MHIYIYAYIFKIITSRCRQYSTRTTLNEHTMLPLQVSFVDNIDKDKPTTKGHRLHQYRPNINLMTDIYGLNHNIYIYIYIYIFVFVYVIDKLPYYYVLCFYPYLFNNTYILS